MSHTILNSASRSPMWLYEENFRLLHRILPDVDTSDFYAVRDDDEQKDVEIEVLERCRYTVTLRMTKYFGHEGRLPDLRMAVRVYYDASVVEVTSYQECSRVPPRYAVSEGDVEYGKDEKHQVNKLLHDLLRYCLHRGRQAVGESRCTSA